MKAIRTAEGHHFTVSTCDPRFDPSERRLSGSLLNQPAAAHPAQKIRVFASRGMVEVARQITFSISS